MADISLSGQAFDLTSHRYILNKLPTEQRILIFPMNKHDSFLTFQMTRTLESPENHFLPAPIKKKKKKKKKKKLKNHII